MNTLRFYDNGCSSTNGCGSSNPSPTTAPAVTSTPTLVMPIELHVCMGLNACKGHDRFGTNNCAGMGYCATVTHVCHALNNCRDQGGCGLYGSAEEQEIPSQNECAFKGSCASPIQKERISTQGTNTGQSTWARARELFEARLTKEGREFGDSPYPDGPPTRWLKTLGPFDACGSSGDMFCTFGLKGGLCGTKAEASTSEAPHETNLCKTAQKSE